MRRMARAGSVRRSMADERRAVYPPTMIRKAQARAGLGESGREIGRGGRLASDGGRRFELPIGAVPVQHCSSTTITIIIMSPSRARLLARDVGIDRLTWLVLILGLPSSAQSSSSTIHSPMTRHHRILSPSRTSAANHPSDHSSVRLHISPLSPDLLSSYLTAGQQTLACDISYHNIQTFPEKNFGYVTLPTMEAQKVKKKFNGATPRGSRVRVQEANPEKRQVEREEPSEESSRKKRRKKSAEHGVLPGFELPMDRTVKRGWTDPDARPATRSRKDRKGQEDDKPKQQPSKYTKNPELLFRAKLPPTAELPARSKSKAKKKSNRHSAADVAVHEFENTQQFPAFLKPTHVDRKPNISRRFVEGEGWLDAEGNCVEEDKSFRSQPRKPPAEPDSQPAASPTKSKKNDKKRKQSPAKDVPESGEPNTIKADDIPPAAPEAKPKRTSSRKSKPPALELKLPQDDQMPEAEVLDPKDATSKKPVIQLRIRWKLSTSGRRMNLPLPPSSLSHSSVARRWTRCRKTSP